MLSGSAVRAGPREHVGVRQHAGLGQLRHARRRPARPRPRSRRGSSPPSTSRPPSRTSCTGGTTCTCHPPTSPRPESQLGVLILLAGTPSSPAIWAIRRWRARHGQRLRPGPPRSGPGAAVRRRQRFVERRHRVRGQPAGPGRDLPHPRRGVLRRPCLGLTTDPARWGIVGFSEGGTCAYDLALRHPGLFHYVVDLAGDAAPNVAGSTLAPALRRLAAGHARAPAVVAAGATRTGPTARSPPGSAPAWTTPRTCTWLVTRPPPPAGPASTPPGSPGPTGTTGSSARGPSAGCCRGWPRTSGPSSTRPTHPLHLTSPSGSVAALSRTG